MKNPRTGLAHSPELLPRIYTFSVIGGGERRMNIASMFNVKVNNVRKLVQIKISINAAKDPNFC